MSLRTRLILTFTLVVLICLFIAAAVVSVLLQGARERTVIANLESKALPIYIQFRSLVTGQVTMTGVWANLQEQAQSNNIYIILIDGSGNIIRQISPQENQTGLKITTGLPYGGNQQTSGTFTTASRAKYFYVAYPLNRATVSTVQAIRFDTIILATPRNVTLAIWSQIIGPFFWAGIVSLIISNIIAVLLARSIYRPVQRLSAAAGSVAEGRFDRVPAEGPAELQYLANNFNEMSDKVKESQAHLRQFVADTSHQLKSPLTSIQGFAQAMLDGTAGDEETKRKATQIIADESKRMIRQLNELLELSRMQAGQLKMTAEPVDLREIIDQCAEIFTLRLQEKHQQLQKDIGNLPAVCGDADRLEDVFCNLLDNAIKNAPLMGEIRISSRQMSGFVEISVADTGPGIPPEQLPYVFQRYHQGTDPHSGTGLGLSIAREIVLAHKGKINVSSQPGEGATFTVVLPVA